MSRLTPIPTKYKSRWIYKGATRYKGVNYSLYSWHHLSSPLKSVCRPLLISPIQWLTLKPQLSEWPVLGLWMTFEGKFIQKEGARSMRNTNFHDHCHCCVPHDFFCQWRWSHSNTKIWFFSQEIFKVKNELTCIFVDAFLYIETSC